MQSEFDGFFFFNLNTLVIACMAMDHSLAWLWIAVRVNSNDHLQENTLIDIMNKYIF